VVHILPSLNIFQLCRISCLRFTGSDDITCEVFSAQHCPVHDEPEPLGHVWTNYDPRAASARRRILTVPRRLPELVRQMACEWRFMLFTNISNTYFKNLDTSQTVVHIS